MSKPRGLTPKQQAFVEQMPLHDFNITAAAVAAGYSYKSADRNGHKLVQEPKIAEAIEAAKRERSEKAQYDAQNLLDDLLDVLRVAKVEAMTGDPKSINAFNQVSNTVGRHITIGGFRDQVQVDVVDHEEILNRALQRAEEASRKSRER